MNFTVSLPQNRCGCTNLMLPAESEISPTENCQTH